VHRGYVKIWRKIRDCDLWYWNRGAAASPLEAWLDLVMLAAHEECTVSFRGRKVRLQRGELAFTVRGLAARWRWDKMRVARFLAGLEARDKIAFQMRHCVRHLCIVNYELYQGDRDSERDKDGEKVRHRTRIKRKKNTSLRCLDCGKPLEGISHCEGRCMACYVGKKSSLVVK